MPQVHVPVFLKETLHYLKTNKNKTYIDATVDGGGMAEAILKATAPSGKLLGIEWDPVLFQIAQQKLKQFGNRVVVTSESYTKLVDLCKQYKFPKADGIVFDFGLSSWHLEQSGRGFSFQKDEPLDMRFNPGVTTLNAAQVLKRYSVTELTRLFRIYGNERYAQKIASSVAKERQRLPIERTSQLVEIIEQTVPRQNKKFSLHPATRVFQALRIEVNNELENIQAVLPKTIQVLKPGSKIVCIAFHSLEDKIVKNFLKESSKTGKLKIITKKPIEPSDTEINKNPRARSAKLRAAEVISN